MPSNYEQYRHMIVTRLSDKLPPKLLNDVMQEIDLLSQGFDIVRSCTDLIPVSGMPEMVKMYLASLAVENCSRETIKNYGFELTHFFEHVSKGYLNVTTNDIRCYLGFGQINKGWKPKTADHIRTVVTGFYQWLLDNEYINRNPAKNIKPLKIPKTKLPPLKQIELEHFRNACRTDRERALVDFLFATGCRVTEAARVLLSDIDWNERAVHIRHGKGDKERWTYFNAEAELSIRRYLDNRNGDSEYLFCKGRAPFTGVSRNTLEAEIRAIRERIPEKLSIKVTPHTFRRTMGTSAVSRGCPVEKVKELLGHVSLDTTMQYITIEQSEVKQAHQKYLAG